MTFGPEKVIECPYCDTIARVSTIAMVGSFGRRLWTDGREWPHWEMRGPEITRCHSCGRYFWISDAKKIGEIRGGIMMMPKKSKKVPKEWTDAPWVKDLTTEERLEAISLSVARCSGPPLPYQETPLVPSEQGQGACGVRAEDGPPAGRAPTLC